MIIIPVSSGGIGIPPDLITPLFYKDPITVDSGQQILYTHDESDTVSALNDFIDEIYDGSSNVVKGIYNDNHFALPVIQQPAGKPGFVSNNDGITTQFKMANKYDVIGILAHNYLSGRIFFELNIGDVIKVVYGDGEISEYLVADIKKYQALQPRSPDSQFVDTGSGEELSATQLFKRVYMGDTHLTLQTCIQEGLEESWGRMFIIANPI